MLVSFAGVSCSDDTSITISGSTLADLEQVTHSELMDRYRWLQASKIFSLTLQKLSLWSSALASQNLAENYGETKIKLANQLIRRVDHAIKLQDLIIDNRLSWSYFVFSVLRGAGLFENFFSA